MLFYGTYVRDVVCKTTRDCDCCVANVGIRCYGIFRETFSKWIFLGFSYIYIYIYIYESPMVRREF